MMEYIGLYKCRLCGETYKSCATGSLNIVMKCMLPIVGSILAPENREPQAPSKQTIHFCDDGSKGVADFIGFKLEEENANKETSN